MIVAIDTRFSKTYQEFIYQCFKIITANHPKHTFIFLADTEFDLSFNSTGNIIPVIVKQTKIYLLSQLKTSSLLKKYKADIFVTGQLQNTNIPQCLVALNKTGFKSLRRAKVIVTDSEFSKNQITEKYNLVETRVDVVYNGVDENFQPVELDEKEKIKEQYADGNEYFLSAVTTTPGLLNLLKAFSIFKKMQKSNMQLLITAEAGMITEFSEALRLYKFKSEVKLIENIEKKQLLGITGAAYAFVYMEEEYFHVFPAMRSNVPVITTDSDLMHEIAGDAALYFSGNDHKDLADKMMLVYKDENLRQQLIEKGREQEKKYSWYNSAELLWKAIEKAAN
ncbi:MAG TPA: glycosyltransferase [Flavitalea sp.]|nr:glycosyltransferase [Flavitalea sp.]